MKISQAGKLLRNKSKSHTAFSLIELSIVILIIGIIVTAVTSSSSLLGRASLTAARKYTADSTVRFSQNVVAWYDATSEGAFGATTAIITDKSQLTTSSASTNVFFDDVYTASYDANIITTQSSNVTYAKAALNGLPAADFNTTTVSAGAANALATPATFSAISGNEATIFVVARWSSVANSVLLERTGDFSIKQTATPGNVAVSISNSAVIDVTSDLKADGVASVMSFAYSKSDNKLYVYKNGTTATTTGYSVTAGTVTASDRLYIGSGGAGTIMSNADIGEIILFSRKLTDAERKEVEAYLGAKWKVKVAS